MSPNSNENDLQTSLRKHIIMLHVQMFTVIKPFHEDFISPTENKETNVLVLLISQTSADTSPVWFQIRLMDVLL